MNPESSSEAFARRLQDILNDGGLALLISIGHQTGLFDTMAQLAPSGCRQIAEAAELNERYVREWLGGMVAGRIVHYDPAAQHYYLPAEHVASLTRNAGTANLASYMQYIAMLGEVEQKIVHCFRCGGGVPYSDFPRFQRMQSDDTTAVFDETLIEKVLPLVPGLVTRMETGIEVADIGCGRGHAINLLARAFPKSRFTGYDLSEEGIADGMAEAAAWKLENARFELRDAADLDAHERFDVIFAFDAIHDQAQPTRVLRNIHRALKPGGMFVMEDIAASSRVEKNAGLPLAPLLYAISTLHCMTVSLAEGGEGWGAMWGEEMALEKLTEAGFARVTIRQVEGDRLNQYYLAEKG